MVIDLRYHLTSLIAVFFALGLGILVGTSLSHDGALLKEQAALISSIEGQVGLLSSQREALALSLAAAKARAEALDQFGQAVLPYLVEGRLSGERVALVIAGDAVPAGEVAEKVSGALERAGAEITGTLFLHGGALARRDWQNAAEATSLFQSLTRSLVEASPGPPTARADARERLWDLERKPGPAADWAIFVSNLAAGGGPPPEVIRNLYAAIAAAPVRLVAAASLASGAAAGGGAGLLAVDDVETPAGLVALVQGMSQGLTGRFGARKGALALLPPLDVWRFE